MSASFARGSRRDPFASSGFDGRQGDTSKGVKQALLVSKQTGVLDLRGRGLHELPPGAFDPDADPVTEHDRKVYTSTIDFDSPDAELNAPNWWETHDLTSIVASRNHITSIPDAIKNLTCLQKLDVSRNQLQSLPGEALVNLPLRSLDVSHNALTDLPDALPETLAQLKCSHNKNMWRLPDFIGACGNLAELEANNCNLQKLPASLARCGQLVHLNLSNNALEIIPDVISKDLPNMTDLDLSRNKLMTFPFGFQNAGACLRRLDLRENLLENIPDCVGNFKVLNELFLGSNRLAGSLSDVIGNGCTSLVTLDVSRNRLNALPASLSNLKTTLAAIDASENDLQFVAPEIGTCGNLRSLMLIGNPLRSIRQAVVTGPTRELLKLLKARLPEGLDDGDTETGAFGAGGDKQQTENDARRVVLAAINKSTSALDGVSINPKPRKALNPLNPKEINVDLRGRGLVEIPEEVWSSGVSSLDLGANSLSEISPETVEQCTTLRSLSLDGNKLETWPLPTGQTGSNTLSLRALRLDGNLSLSGFLSDKNSFSSVPFLTSLDLSKLKAHSFAEGCLSPLVDTLEHLRWEKGGLASVPVEVYKMKHLKTLRLGDNRIESIERSIANLQNLDELDVKNNELAQLPPDLGLLSLRSLQLEGNPLRSIRRAVIEKGTTAVLAYLKDKMPIA